MTNEELLQEHRMLSLKVAFMLGRNENNQKLIKSFNKNQKEVLRRMNNENIVSES